MTSTTFNSKIQSHSVRTGVFAVFATITVGALLGVSFGFASPNGTNAQFIPAPIVVTAPIVAPIAPTPIVPVVTPIFAPTPVVYIAPVATQPTNNGNDSSKEITVTASPTQDVAPTVPVTVATTPTAISPVSPVIVVTGTPSQSDTNKQPVVTATTPITPNDIVVTAVNQTSDFNGSPCCTQLNTPSNTIVVTAPTQNSDFNGSPCCTQLTTPSNTIVVTAPTQNSDFNGSPCCTQLNIPSIPTIVVTAPTQNSDFNGSPCCTQLNTPSNTIVVTAPTQQSDFNGSPCCTQLNTPSNTIVVTAPTQQSDFNGSPCCTQLNTPSNTIVVTAPTQQSDFNGSPCCTQLNTPSTPVVVTAPNQQSDFNGSPCCTTITTPVIIPPVVVPPVIIPPVVTPPVITPPTPPTPTSCISLTENKNVITNPGEDVVLNWQVSNNAGTVTITNVSTGKTIGTYNSLSGSLTVNPAGNTTYHASVANDTNNSACTVSVSLTTTTTGGGGGGTSGGGNSGGSSGGYSGGGSSGSGYTPSAFYTSSTRGSVSLSQIPYTGLDLGTFGTIIYWTMLILWSLAATYLVLFTIIPFLKRKLVAFGVNVGQALAVSPALIPHHAVAGVSAGAHMLSAAPKAAVSTSYARTATQIVNYSTPATPARAEMTGEGFKRFASSGALSIDDIVKGLSRESGMELSAGSENEGSSAQAPAPAASAKPEAPAAPVAAPVQTPAPAPQPKAPPAQAPASPVDTNVVGFIASILNGERDAVFTTIRRMTQAGHDAEEFMAQAICALDDAYHARIDGTPVHEDVQKATAHCATPFLEKLVTSLTTAVDGSYSMNVTGIKLALTRALAVSQG